MFGSGINKTIWFKNGDDFLNPNQKKVSLFSWISLVLAILVWFLVFRVFDYQVNNFRIYNLIALPVSLVPLVTGVIALYKREKNKVASVLGIVIAVITFFPVLMIVLLFGM